VACRFCAYGSCVAINGAKSATRISSASTTSPKSDVGERVRKATMLRAAIRLCGIRRRGTGAGMSRVMLISSSGRIRGKECRRGCSDR